MSEFPINLNWNNAAEVKVQGKEHEWFVVVLDAKDQEIGRSIAFATRMRAGYCAANVAVYRGLKFMGG